MTHGKMLSISSHQENANQTPSETHFTPTGRLLSKPDADKRCRGRAETGAMQLLLWTGVGQFIKKLNRELTYDPAIPVLGAGGLKTGVQTNTCS